MWKVYWQGARPKTLSTAIVPIAVATALAYRDAGKVSLLAAFVALLASLFIQIGTNLFNDVLDFAKGTDRAERIGPTRITAAGLATPTQVKLWAWGSFAVAFALGVWLAVQGGWPILAIGILSLISGYLYTGGPYPLAYHGLGDLFVLLFFGFAAVVGMYWLHAHELSASAWWLGLIVGCLATVLIAINNLRDAEQDVHTGKLTLPARFGKTFGRLQITLLSFAPYVLLLLWSAVDPHGRSMAGLLPLFAIPASLILVFKTWTTPPSPAYNKLLGMASGVNLLFGLLLSIGLWIGS